MLIHETTKIGDTVTAQVSARVLDSVDVLVAGGGTAGVIAAIAAARHGARTLLVERSGVPGGMMTRGNAGLTTYTVHEKDPAEYRALMNNLKDDPAAAQIVGGITMEMTRRLIAAGGALATDGEPGTYVFTAPEEFRDLLLDMLREANVELLLHSVIVDAVTDREGLRGVVVESKAGREILLAKVVIDCTGDGDVAARAGVPFQLGSGPDDLVTKHGLPPHTLQAMGVMFRLANIDVEALMAFLAATPARFAPQSVAMMPLNEALARLRKKDMATFYLKVTSRLTVQVYNSPLPGVMTFCCPCVEGSGLSNRELTGGELELARMIRGWVDEMKTGVPGFAGAFLIDQPEICTRETRHIRGEYLLTAGDILSMRHFEDCIGRGGHPIDIWPIPPEFENFAMPHKWSFEIPYRCLVPLRVENLLVAGRCLSATREVSGCTRPTVQCMITGEAAGVAAGLCVQTGTTPRKLDIGILRQALQQQKVVLN